MCYVMRLNYDELLRAELRGGLRARVGQMLRYGLVAGQVTVLRGGLQARVCQYERCVLVAGQVTMGLGRLPAQISSLRRAFIYIYIYIYIFTKPTILDIYQNSNYFGPKRNTIYNNNFLN